jgi:dihydrofolate reductase
VAQVAAPRVQIYSASSVDGYLAPPDGSLEWLEVVDDAADFGFDDFYSHVGTAICGRTTFDQVTGFGRWPYDNTPVVVLTTHEPPADYPANVTFDDGSDLTALTQRLRETAGERNVWLLGGAKVHQQFLAAGLVDEIWTHVLPILLGDGIRLLPPPYDRRPVRLIESRTYENGAVMGRYSLT